MFRVVALLLFLGLTAAGVDSLACGGRFRLFGRTSRCCDCPPPVCCEQPAPDPEPGPDGGEPPPLTQVEESQLQEILEAYRKASTYDAAGLKKYEEFYRSTTPEERVKDYKQRPQSTADLTPQEKSRLEEILRAYKKMKKYDEKGLKDYEEFYRSTTPKERAKDYDEIKGKDNKKSQVGAPGKILVHLPEDATLTMNGYLTTSTSDTRFFHTPPIKANTSFYYEARATVERNGMRATATRMIHVQPGETTEITIDVPMNALMRSARK